jgi:hypothetical protein
MALDDLLSDSCHSGVQNLNPGLQRSYRLLQISAMFLFDFIGSLVPGSPHFIPSILTKEIQELEDFLRLGHVFHLSDLVSSFKGLKGWLTIFFFFS